MKDPAGEDQSSKSTKFSPRFYEALRRFDQENEQDPNLIVSEGIAHPQELLYAKRLTDWVLRLASEASEHLLLAARCQHICRWRIPRDSYEMTRSGYLRWRNDLKQFHANKSAEILREVGYDEDTVDRVRELNLKKQLGRDPECQILEDALCLVTLQYQLADLAAKTEPGKMVEILRKTWKKMSQDARIHALRLHYSEAEKPLIDQALA
jgi:uncharacterized protein DUF4202